MLATIARIANFTFCEGLWFQRCFIEDYSVCWFLILAKGLKFFQELTGHLAPVSFCAFSPDGSCLATSSFDKTIIIWDPVS